MRPGLRVALAVALGAAVGACGDRQPETAEPAGGPATSSPSGGTVSAEVTGRALDACADGDADGGIAALDSALALAPGAADARVARGLCLWTRWGDSGDDADAQRAYDDLSAAIDAVEDDPSAERATPLDQMYAHRAFVANALDGDWRRTLEDLGRAVEIAPDDPTHVLDRGVVRSYAGAPDAARADWQRFLALADPEDSRRAVVEELIDGLDAE